MSLAQAVSQAADSMAVAGLPSPRHEARLLAAHVLGMSKEQTLVRGDETVPATALEELLALATRRAAGEPLAYLLGAREFWSLPFEVTPATLIPRPESELLVEGALRFARERNLTHPRVLDLGTGSGCLLLSVLSEIPSAQGVGLDISEAALAVARRNAEKLDLGSRARFVVGDWGRSLDAEFDIILCNPPYVAEDDRPALAPEVASFEPEQALFAGRDGADAYRALAPHMVGLLSSAGGAFIELAANSAEDTSVCVARFGLTEVDRLKDLAGLERCSVFSQVAQIWSGPRKEWLTSTMKQSEIRKKGLKTVRSRLGSSGRRRNRPDDGRSPEAPSAQHADHQPHRIGLSAARPTNGQPTVDG